jgi:hypothetical protein
MGGLRLEFRFFLPADLARIAATVQAGHTSILNWPYFFLLVYSGRCICPRLF